MLHDLYVVAFSMATGFTASGIIASLYLLLFPKAESTLAKTAHIGVMVFAGPSVLFQSSFEALREQRSSAGAFWLSSAIAGYWSLALGLIVLRIFLAF
jgi:hypothetical protein